MSHLHNGLPDDPSYSISSNIEHNKPVAHLTTESNECNTDQDRPSNNSSLLFGEVMPVSSSTTGRTTAAIMLSLTYPGVDIVLYEVLKK
ncbi:unnamed protein product [Adineta ricciae]|uniref:Uncharacterized protein n=1 Tax=Adineta ricciae TaxID=249248 RepID=A0A815YDU3_ADIRI|nr:unnamed protein product [Adineta ricciae]CAF1569470.1 unnamed protein product [Adineta ricciae]